MVICGLFLSSLPGAFKVLTEIATISAIQREFAEKKDSTRNPNEVRRQERRVLHKTCQDRILKRRFKYLDGLQRCERPHDGWRLIRNVRLAR